MDTNTDNGQHPNSGDNNNNQSGQGAIDTSTPNSQSLESDPVFSRHLDIAIEAQDGKPNAKVEDKSKEGDEGRQPAADNKDSKGGARDDKSQQQPKQEGKKDEGKAPSPKDLKLADGTVVKGGQERRFYEQREVARQQLNHANTQLTERTRELERVRGELDAMRGTVQSVNGADPRDVALGVNIVTDLKRDPVGTMKKLLAEVVAQGHTIEGIGSGVDQLAMQRMIDARLPKQDTQQDAGNDEAAVTQEVNQFFGQFPDARTHEPLIARVLQDHPQLSLQDAYFALKESFIEKGLDWSLPLDKQLEAASGGQPNSQQQQQPEPKPLPNGNGTAHNQSQVKAIDDVNVAHEDTDMGDIIKAAMRAEGLNV